MCIVNGGFMLKVNVSVFNKLISTDNALYCSIPPLTIHGTLCFMKTKHIE